MKLKNIKLKDTGANEGTYISQDMNIFKYLKKDKKEDTGKGY